VKLGIGLKESEQSELITIYKAYYCDDYGDCVQLGYFLSRKCAEDCAGRQSQNDSFQCQEIKVFESKKDFQENSINAIRRRALDKLTDEEKEGSRTYD
jgi:hypothetical protein